MKELNTLLANIAVAKQKGYNMHWNIKGGDFLDWHKILEEYYTQLEGFFDQVAEKVAMFGEFPLSTLADYVANATIKEIKPKHFSWPEAIEILLGDIKEINKSIDALPEDKYICPLVDELNMYFHKFEWIIKSHK